MLQKKSKSKREKATSTKMAEDEFRDDLYEILGIEAASDEKRVARAYKKKSLLHHPDRGGDGA